MIIKEFKEKNFMEYPVINYKYFIKITKNEKSPDTIN